METTKLGIMNSKNTDRKDKPYPLLSELVFIVCREMVQRGVPDQVIYSVITDPKFGISRSVLSKGIGAETYALRHITKAHEMISTNQQTGCGQRKMPVQSIPYRHKLLRVERKLLRTLADYALLPDDDATLKEELVILESMYKELIDEQRST